MIMLVILISQMIVDLQKAEKLRGQNFALFAPGFPASTAPLHLLQTYNVAPLLGGVGPLWQGGGGGIGQLQKLTIIFFLPDLPPLPPPDSSTAQSTLQCWEKPW